MFAVLLAARNEWAAWAVVGAVLSSFLCKVLKTAINESRPAGARKADPGMPSSHSNSERLLRFGRGVVCSCCLGDKKTAAPTSLNLTCNQ